MRRLACGQKKVGSMNWFPWSVSRGKQRIIEAQELLINALERQNTVLREQLVIRERLNQSDEAYIALLRHELEKYES